MKGSQNLTIIFLFILASLSLLAGIASYLLLPSLGKEGLITGLIFCLIFVLLGFKLHLKRLTNTLLKVQEQSLRQEKMAQVGLLTAGIAHEIKNPLNFVNNFSRLTQELFGELKETLHPCLSKAGSVEQKEIQEIINDIQGNLDKLLEHGKRAESIVQNMLSQSRKTPEEKIPTAINELVAEYINLAYHGMRAQNINFNVKIEKSFADNLPEIKLLRQSMGRVLLNILNNGMYAAFSKKETQPKDFMPTVRISTAQQNGFILITIRDNGPGIDKKDQENIFEPFYTTKPKEEGTGLGLPISLDIVNNQHNGKLLFGSQVGEYTEFQIVLPINQKA